MEKPWLKSYPPGIPDTVDVHSFPSLLAVYQQAIERFGDAPAFINMGATLSFNQLAMASRDMAAWL